MEQITVEKKDHATLYVDCEPSTARELCDFFTFYVPGYKFMPAYKNRVWDGKVRLYNLKKKELPIGLYHYVLQFAEAAAINVAINENEWGVPGESIDLDGHDLYAFIETLKLSVRGEDIEPRDYQFNAVRHCLVHNHSLLLSPTASGKSLIIYLLVRWFLHHCEGDALIVVPTTSLVEQMASDFAEYSAKDASFDVERDVHKIYSGMDRDEQKRITITTWQSIYKLPRQWFSRYGCVVGDEAHNFKAKSLTGILSKCINAKYRYGTTGTLDGTETHQLVLEGLFGKVHKVITTKELMEKDAVAQLNIDVLLLKYADDLCKQVSGYKYSDEVEFLVTYPPRNRLIRNLAMDCTGNTLVLFNYVEKHGKPLYELIKKKVEQSDPDRMVFYISGEVNVDAREQARKITETQTNAIIVASLGTFSTGVNIRNLHNIIFASPSKSQVKVLQSIGRGLRKSDDGRATKLFDLADDLHWKSRKNYTLEHAGVRIQMYTKEKFEYEIHEVELRDE